MQLLYGGLLGLLGLGVGLVMASLLGWAVAMVIVIVMCLVVMGVMLLLLAGDR
ncbi:hypothetical protein LCGC14_2132130 [marine sediment metagenome]|uniref:Uncharacterized protein n=1 Tax=marine sediment metagenome TaxID=412755 RepID=A0A0F9GX35_9ZZZZ